MRFVWDFNHGRADFEVVGTFTREDEAKSFAENVKPMGSFRPVAAQMTWQHVIDSAVAARLGKLAKALGIGRADEG